MSDLYYEALNKYFDIKTYLDSLNERNNYLYSQSIVIGAKCNDRENVNTLNDINRELAKVREDIQIYNYLFGQISSIVDKFFKEYHFKDTPKSAETDYIEFINSSTYKTVMSGARLEFKAS